MKKRQPSPTTALPKPSKLQNLVRELQRVLQQQADRLETLTLQVNGNSEFHEDVQAALRDIQSALVANGGINAEKIQYQQMVHRIRQIAHAQLPRDATVLVISKGDPALLRLHGRVAWHFPQSARGGYAGYYPASSTSAIAHLEALRAQGASHLILPKQSLWWIEHYSAFARHLKQHYRLMVQNEEACFIYSLAEAAESNSANSAGQVERLVTDFRMRFEREPAVLDWQSGLGLAQMLPHLIVFQPTARESPLPYLDHSVDIVVTSSVDPHAESEARRVASAAVLTSNGATDGIEPTLTIEWQPGTHRADLPGISIIIPCHNGYALTDACLRALAPTLPPAWPVEIIVADDASIDDTSAGLKQWITKDSRIKVVRNRRNLGFVDTCNRGVRAAKGDILIFLNNDTLPLAGWMQALLRVFRDFPEAGAVGGKLIFPDGTLQEAGGVIFRDGSAMHFGRGSADLDAPLYSFVREVDYCSGALLATPRALFEELGGFDPNYRPGYYEDVDYCFKVREKGCPIYYQPESVVVHREGGTAGTDASIGMKRYQQINQAKFIERWKQTLECQPIRPKNVDDAVLQRLAVRDVAELWR